MHATEEQKCLQNQERQLKKYIKGKIKETFGFFPNTSISPFQNALQILGNTLIDIYLTRPNNLAFHDLTNGRVMPKASKSILGLSHKFIPVPKTTPHDLSAMLERFEREIHLKAYFAMQPLGNETPKLYVKSTWSPPFRSIPREIDQRLTTFFKAIHPLFKKHKAKITYFHSKESS